MMNEQELMHFGVKGMKWGVRRVSKKYKKYMTKAQQEVNSIDNRRYINAWNKAADSVNKKYKDVNNQKSTKRI